MEATLKTLLFAIATVALVSGLNVLIGGAAAVPGSLGPVEATVDNELRFFSVFWIGFGAFCFMVARQVDRYSSFIPLIALFFFLGGVGRLLSTIMIGEPAAILIPAMILEFVLPLILYGFYWRHFKINLPTETRSSAG